MVDYSKWKNIEISDDEDDTHPNIDTPSLFRWRHQARVQRMEEKQAEKEKIEKEKKEYEARVKALKNQLEEANTCTDEAEKLEKKRKAEKQLAELQKDMQKVQLKQKEMEKKERLEPWNVDSISAPGFDKSLINKDLKLNKTTKTEEEKENELRDFVKKYEKEIKEYGMFRRYEDSMKYMQEHTHLASDNTANYLVIWCINLELDDKNELMRHVAHQAICLQFILELASQLDRDPRSCISAFFHKIQQAAEDYKKVFNDELAAFIARIERRAKEKVAEAEAEVEREEREKRLGPGGLDPLEVLEQLPEKLRTCFESQDIGELKKVIAEMDRDEATKHMKACVASGLWVPEGGADTSDETGLLQKDKEEEEEEIYISVEDTVD